MLLMWVKEISFGHFVLCFQVLQETHVASTCNLSLFFIGLKKIQPRYHNERGKIGIFYNGVVYSESLSYDLLHLLTIKV